MGFRQNFIQIFTGILFTVSANLAFAQQLSKEPAGGPDEMELEASEALLPPSTIALPSIMDISPVNKFYSSWDTLCVRRSTQPIPQLDESITLPLYNEYSHGFCMPVEGTFLSPFGHRGRRVHAGVDLKLEAGDPVGSAFDGVVRLACRYKGYGNCVVIRHYNGLETLYGHLSKIEVKVNQPVKAGEIIGLGGRTGRATCNHLHFETRFQGKAFNPRQLIDFNSFTLLSDTLTIANNTFGLSRDYLPVNMHSDSLIADNSSVRQLASKKSVKSSKGHKFHTIKSGETIGGISLHYGTSVKQICSINGIRPSKILRPGTKIRIK